MGHLNGETIDLLMKPIPIGRRQLRRHFCQYRASSYCRQTDFIDTNNNSARPFLTVGNGERHAVPTIKQCREVVFARELRSCVKVEVAVLGSHP